MNGITVEAKFNGGDGGIIVEREDIYADGDGAPIDRSDNLGLLDADASLWLACEIFTKRSVGLGGRNVLAYLVDSVVKRINMQYILAEDHDEVVRLDDMRCDILDRLHGGDLVGALLIIENQQGIR